MATGRIGHCRLLTAWPAPSSPPSRGANLVFLRDGQVVSQLAEAFRSLIG